MANVSEDNFKQIEAASHSALFYENPREQLSISLPFIKRGLEKGDKCIYVTSVNPPGKIITSLGKIYPKTQSALKSEQLQIIRAKDFYLRKGYFDIDTTFSDIEAFYLKAKKDGYNTVRGTGEMGWIKNNMEFLGSLRDYEIKLTSYINELSNYIALCQYNTNNYTGEFLKDMVMIHSCVISGTFNGGMYPYSL